MIGYQENSVVSREIVRKETGTVTIFAFDKGEGLSEHTAPFDAMVQVVDGIAGILLFLVTRTLLGRENSHNACKCSTRTQCYGTV